MSTRVFEVAKAPNPRRSTLVFTPLTPPNRLVSCTPGAWAMISCSVCAGECAISCAVMTVDGRADDAGKLPDGGSASALSVALRCDVGAGPRRGIRVAGRRAVRRDAARARPFIIGWFGAGPVLVVGRADLDRRQLFGRRGLLCVRAGNAQGKQRDEKTGGEQDGATPGGGDGGRHGSGLGMTSVARHSEPSPTIVLKAAQVKLMPVLPDRHLRV